MRDEAVQLLQGLVRIDTSNPPGNETKAAEHLKSILAKEAIPSEIFALEPSRGNLVARLKGNGRKKPVLLMGYTDVVGVERDKRNPRSDNSSSRRSAAHQNSYQSFV